MYLSRLILNPRHKRVQRELAHPYELHRTILSAFPAVLPPDERVLYRPEVDDRGLRVILFVQSQYPPDWRWAAEIPGYLLRPPETKPFDLHLVEGQVLAFRLRANPTVKKKSHEKPNSTPPRNGVRLGLLREEDQRAWLERKGEQHGFRILRALIIPEGMQVGYKTPSEEEEKFRLAHLAVRFEGLLQVTDPTLLREAVRQGIGSAKGFGFGLLSLGPATLARTG
ncbi:MAG: type I-E CRISPR-associated protein Cas6/Cse3/CasE [Chloroflexi bacterium]|nr:type I-E CRISPR-associated protein Cas6/Cse3/CasE [Chloroflexota bacterium]